MITVNTINITLGFEDEVIDLSLDVDGGRVINLTAFKGSSFLNRLTKSLVKNKGIIKGKIERELLDKLMVELL